MPESLERKTFWNDGSSYFQGDWLVESSIPTISVDAADTSEQDITEFANAAWIYRIDITTASISYTFKIWNDEARSTGPVLHLVKTSSLANYRRLMLYVDKDRAAKLHFDITNNDAVTRDFVVKFEAVRQI